MVPSWDQYIPIWDYGEIYGAKWVDADAKDDAAAARWVKSPE